MPCTGYFIDEYFMNMTNQYTYYLVKDFHLIYSFGTAAQLMWRIFKEKLFTCSHFGLKYNLCRHKSPLEWGCGEWQQVEYTVPVSTKILCMISKGDSFAVYCIFQMATLIAGCKQNTRQISIHTPIHMQKGCRWMSFLSQRCFTLSSCYLIFWLQNKSCILFFAFNIGDNPACWKER